MTEEFDLKKFLTQMSHVSRDEFPEHLLRSQNDGLTKYLVAMQIKGEELVESNVPEQERDLLMSTLISSGVLTQYMLMKNDDSLPQSERVDRMLEALFFVVEHRALLNVLAQSMVCTLLGMAVTEGWTEKGTLDINVPDL